MSGGTTITLKVNKHIQKVTRKIKNLFLEYNESFPSEPHYTLDCIDVTDRMSGSFWIDCDSDVQVLLKNRIIIDSWCKWQRAGEERELIKRDIVLLRSHILSDITALNGGITFNHQLSAEECRVFICLVRKRVIDLENDLINVDWFHEYE